MTKIAMLHTSFVFVNVETQITDLMGELMPDDEVIHFVDSDVLATVMREGEISPTARPGWCCSPRPPSAPGRT